MKSETVTRKILDQKMLGRKILGRKTLWWAAILLLSAWLSGMFLLKPAESAAPNQLSLNSPVSFPVDI